MEKQERSKMLGTMHMGRLVPKVSIPIMISMLVQALYNVVDGIFVARYSADSFTAVSLVFPIQMLMIAVGTGLSVGINSLVSRRLGEGRAQDARDAARNGIFLELCGGLLFCLFGIFGARSFMHVFTQDQHLNGKNQRNSRQRVGAVAGHKDAVHHVVKRLHHHADHNGHRYLGHQFAHGHAAQHFGSFLLLHTFSLE